MTDHKAHVRVLKGFAAAYTGETGEAFRAAIAALTAAPAASEGEDVRLWDSQWVNVVNHANCYEDFTKEEAVAHAVKMTEQYMRANITAGFPHTRPAAQVAATPKHDEGREALVAAYKQGAHDFAGNGYAPAVNTEVDEQAEHYAALATQPAAVTDECGRPMTYWGGKSATQPAARRVTDAECEAVYDAVMRSGLTRDVKSPERKREIVRTALESFAQPAEGVSGG